MNSSATSWFPPRYESSARTQKGQYQKYPSFVKGDIASDSISQQSLSRFLNETTIEDSQLFTQRAGN